MDPEPLKREAVEFYIREVGEETALDLLCHLGLLPPESFAEAPIESFVEAPIESFVEAPIEVPIESFIEAPIKAPIESVAEAPVVESIDETFVESIDETFVESIDETFVEAPIEAPIEAVAEAPVVEASTKSVAQNLATRSCSGMATTSLLQAKFLAKVAPSFRLHLHTRAAVFVFDPGGTNTSNPPAVIPRVF